jgi:hypothetical protein
MLSSITNVAPGGSANQIAAFTWNEIILCIQMFRFWLKKKVGTYLTRQDKFNKKISLR